MQSYLKSAVALISLVIGAAIALFLAYWLAIGFIIGLGLVAALGLFGWISGGFVARSRHRYDRAERDKDGRFVLTIDGGKQGAQGMTDGPDVTLSPEQKHEIVMRHLTVAWDNATADGIDADFLASAMLAAALTNLGRRYGREAAIKLAASLPQRIEDGLLAID